MGISRTESSWLLAGPLLLVGSAAIGVLLANVMPSRQAAFYAACVAALAVLVSFFSVLAILLECWGTIGSLRRRDRALIFVGSLPAAFGLALASYAASIGSWLIIQADVAPRRGLTQALVRMDMVLLAVGSIVGAYLAVRLSIAAAWWWPAPLTIFGVGLAGTAALLALDSGSSFALGTQPIGGKTALQIGLPLGAAAAGAVCTVVALVVSYQRRRFDIKQRTN